ncbi:MFS transporter [Psychromicrobium lacuslunae]|uniref:MFS transporter n=1 Tax=Psychromicrobium lacuslunae TaxID=1618207 RepID=UPI003BF48875
MPRVSHDGAEFSFKKIAIPAFGPSILFGVGEGAILPVIALSARDLGASVAVAALVVTLIGVGSLISNIPASIVTDRYGERWSIVGAAVLSMLAMLLCVFAPNLWVYGLGVLLIGAASAVFNLARQKYLTEAVPLKYRARALSTLGGVMRIGIFIGPFIGALAINFFHLAGAYWVGVVAVIIAGLIALSMPDLVHTAAGDGALASPTLRSTLLDHRKVFLSIGIGVLLVGAVRASRQAVLPLWAEGLGLDPSTTSLIYGLSGAIDMLVFYPAGKLMDRRGRAWVAVPSMVLMGISLLLMPLTSGAFGLLLVALLIGFGNGIGSGVVMTLGADYSPARGRAQFLGIWRFLADLGAFSGPALLSGITAILSLSVGIAATGLIGLGAAAVLWYWIPRTPKISA